MKALKCPPLLLERSVTNGFSLVEMLVVMTIALILATISLLSISGTMTSRTLASGGNQVVDLINEARQNSIAKSTLTALIMVSSSGDNQLDNRAFILADLNSTVIPPSWTPISKWEILPEGVVVNPSLSTLGNPANPPADLSSLSLQYLGTSIPLSAVLYEVFFPDGHILANNASSPATPVFKLVSGVMQSGAIVSTGSGKNYYQITLNPYTGNPIVDRP